MMTKITTTNNATEIIDLAIFKDFFLSWGKGKFQGSRNKIGINLTSIS